MKLHEALRQLFAKYGGRVMDEDAHFDIMGWLSDRQVFDSYPAMKLAMLAVLSNGYGRELWEYSCAGNDARYFKFADWVKQNLMNPYSVQLTGYVVDSVSYGLGMKRTASDAQDLDIRLQDLIASDADAWVKDVDLRKPARIIRRLQCCCLLWFSPDGKHGFLSDVMGAVGLMYYSGSMVEKDYGRAMIWLRRDWDHSEDERAAAAIGTMYYYGYGTVKNYPEAEGWFRKAAGKGLAPAETGIGNMYYFGRGVMQDYGEAAKWYLKAAGKGDRAARNNLAAMKAAGQGGTAAGSSTGSGRSTNSESLIIIQPKQRLRRRHTCSCAPRWVPAAPGWDSCSGSQARRSARLLGAAP